MRRLVDLHLNVPPKKKTHREPPGPEYSLLIIILEDQYLLWIVIVKPRGRFQNLVLKMFSSKNWYKVSFFWINGQYGPLSVPVEPPVTKTEAWQLYQK